MGKARRTRQPAAGSAPWLIVAPTWPEYRAVLQAVRACHADDRTILRRSGVGPDRAAAFAAGLGNGMAIAGIALLGWAGGLTADLAAGDAVVADQALADQQPALACRVLPISEAHIGPMLTSATVLASPDAKATAAACGALAVEMEAYPLAAWAHAHGLPFVHGRVILDGLEESLPDLSGVFDSAGRFRPRRLLAACAERPVLLAELWHFARRTRLANARLTALTAALVAALDASPARDRP